MPDESVQGWREKQKSRLRALLFSTALELFKKQGFEQTTMQQIADAAGVAKGTFFNYFSSKEDVLAEWYRQITLEALKRVTEASFDRAQDGFVALAEALTKAASEEPALWAMKGEHTGTGSVLQHGEKDLDALLTGFCVDTLKAGKARGELAADLDEVFFADTFIALLTGTGQSWNVAGQEFDLVRTMRDRTVFLFRAAKNNAG